MNVGLKDAGVRVLFLAMVSLFVAVLAGTVWLVLVSTIARPMPRTLTERQLAMLRVIVDEKPKVARAWADLARALMAAYDYEQARIVLAEGSNAAGDRAPEILLERGRLASLERREGEAMILLRDAREGAERFRTAELARLAKENVNPDPRVIKGETIEMAALLEGDVHARQRSWSKALKLYDVALRENPNSAVTLLKHGSVNLELKHYPEAVRDFEAAIRLDSHLIAAHHGLQAAESGAAAAEPADSPND